MTALNVQAFRGKVPRESSRLIGQNFATQALNCKITSGRLDPLRGITLVHASLAASIATMFRYRFGSDENWLVWQTVVDVVRSPTAQDSLGRLFYTGDGEPRMTTYADAISGPGPFPANWYVLGVYIPVVAATLVATGGVGTVETRAYVYTFKTKYGEESAPSLPVIASGPIDASWDLSGLDVTPPNSGTITSAVTTAPGVVEIQLDTVRGLSPFEEIVFAAVGGMTSLNTKFQLVTVNAGTNKVTVSLDTAQVYTSGGTWARRAPHNTTSMTKVIYRTLGTGTDYKRVAEIGGGDTTYSDTIASTALGETIPTLNSYTPPKDMHSLVALANGALAGLSGNQLCLSESYKPYSWPIENRYAFAGLGVALCAAANSVIVLTDHHPFVATATVPEAANLARLPTYAPCIAKQGVVDIGGGCLFPSHDGLYNATPSNARNVTDDLYRYDEWQQLVPASFKASFFDRRYYAMHDYIGETAKMLVIDATEPDSVTEVDERVDAIYANPLDGKMYVGKANGIYQWDANDAARYLIFWQSRQFQLGAPLNFSCAQVHARYPDVVPIDTSIVAANEALLANADNIAGAIGSTEIGVYPLGASSLLDAPIATANRVQFALLKNGDIVFTKELNSSDTFRLPGGFQSEIYAMQITASIPIYSMTIAQGMDELKQTSV